MPQQVKNLVSDFQMSGNECRVRISPAKRGSSQEGRM